MLKIMKKHFVFLLAALGSSCFSLFFYIRLQLTKATVIDSALNKNLFENLFYIKILLIFALLYEFLNYLYIIFQNLYIKSTTNYLQNRFFNKLFNKNLNEFNNISQGEILAKFTNQINNLESSFFTPLSQFIQMALQTIFIIYSLILININIAILSIVLFTSAVFVPKLLERKMSEKAKIKMQNFEIHLENFRDWISSLELIKNFNISANIRNKFEDSNNNLYNKELSFEKMYAKSSGMGYLVSMLSRGIVILYSTYLVYKGYLSAGLFFSVLALSEGIAKPLFWMSKKYQDVISAKPVLKSITDFLNVPNKALDEKFSNEIIDKDINIQYRNVGLTFDNNFLFDDVDMEFKNNGKYLITGASGSGKTTCLKLLLRHHKLDTGDIYINGRKLNSINNLHELITYTDQETTLFNASLRDNLTLFDFIEEQVLINMLNRFGLSKFANSSSLDANIQDNGMNLSGGEKKRISLVRSFLKKKSIMIFDEPLANIDKENLMQIEDQLLDIDDSIVIIITHQFSKEKLNRFDKIYNFRNGACYEEILI